MGAARPVPRRPARAAPSLLVLVAFVGLGLPDGMLGVAWPSMRQAFAQPLAALGLLNACITVGYLVTTIANGPLLRRLGTGRHVVLAGSASTLGVLGYVVAPGFATVLGASALIGFGAGALDAGLNAHVALHHGTRLMNLMHGAYGIGTTVGPFVVTAALAVSGWRSAYGALLVLEAALLLAYWSSRRGWPPAAAAAPRRAHVQGRALLPIALGLALFFVYTGIEVAAGQWSYSLLTDARGLSTTAAGVWVGVYWGALAAGRMLAGLAGRRARPLALLHAGTAGALAGALLLWWNPAGLGTIGLALLGLALAPIFPALVSLTPERLGSERAATVIGYQFAAATLGAAAISGASGLAAQYAGLESLPVLFTAGAVLQLALHALLAGRTQARPAR